MSYQVTEGSGSVLITLLVTGNEISVEYTIVIDITNGTATGKYNGSCESTLNTELLICACVCGDNCSCNVQRVDVLLDL